MSQSQSIQLDMKKRHLFRQKKRIFNLRLMLAVVVIVIPTLTATVYSFFLATPMYSAESQFILRGPVTKAVGAGRLFKAASSSNVGFGEILDGFAIRSYILSRSSLNELEKRIKYSNLVAGKGDIITGIGKESGPDDVYDFYLNNIDVSFNIAEGIIRVKTFAYSPEDAVLINKTILSIAEEFANSINARSRNDALKFAREELKDAQKVLQQAQENLKRWQIENGFINPEERSKKLGEIIAELEKLRVKYYIQLIELDSYRKDSSLQREIILKKISAIGKQIQKQRSLLFRSDGKSSLASSLLEYQKLKLAQQLAEKNYENAQKSLQQAQLSLTRKQKYVVPVVRPVLSKQPEYPRPFYIITIVFVVCLSVYILFVFIISSLKDALAT